MNWQEDWGCYFSRSAQRAQARLEDELLELEMKIARRTADMSLTEGRMERKTAVYMDEGEYVHICTAADDSEAPVLGLSRKNKSAMHGTAIGQEARDRRREVPRRGRTHRIHTKG